MSSRRGFFRNTFGFGAGLTAAAKLNSKPVVRTPVLVQTPDVKDLPYKLDNGTKVFHLVAEPVKQRIAPNKVIDAWGFNGSAPGPTIQVTQGDRVRIVFDNHLPETTSMHWHGFEVPHDMDGGPGISQEVVKPGGRFIYEFTLHQEGTYFYHSHLAMQELIGSLGAFIMHPKQPHTPAVDKDFVLLLQEYAVLPNSTTPNTMNMEFNWLVLNGKAGPAASPLIVKQGERVRVRLINLGMDHHPIHLHGHTFYVTGTEGGRIPEAAWMPGNTALVGVAQARDFEFVANNPGAWMLHCHLPHHMMNQMSSNVGPMSRRGTGMPAGVDMNQGMGMITGGMGSPTAEDFGPSLGRGMGVGSTSDQPMGNTPLSPDKAASAMQGMDHEHMQHGASGDISKDANQVPGFPQDAYMEGPMMAVPEVETYPANYKLKPGWSGFMQGMMNFVRVLPPVEYDEVMQHIEASKSSDPQKEQPPENHQMMHHHQM